MYEKVRVWALGKTLIAMACGLAAAGVCAAPVDIGTRLEPLVDNFLIESMKNTELRLHAPTPREIAITYDKPWEGNTSCYVTVFKDDDLFRMYFRGSHYDVATETYFKEKVCYAESVDGITWTRPELGIVDYEGSTANNIVWNGMGSHNFAPFKDTNPDCAPEARYKALAGGKGGGLVAFQSPDAIHWTLVSETPVITNGKFDSQNLAFYDNVRGHYVDFHRGSENDVRAIMTCTSQDFKTWSEPEFVTYGNTPAEHLYTNATIAYPGAPHLFMAFPKRFSPTRKTAVHPIAGVSDGVFMTSRDGKQWNRWREALIRPGAQDSRWVNRNNMTAWGLLQTPGTLPGTPDELSLYSTEGYYVGPCHLRRYTIRQDGFVSVHAGGSEGSFVTKEIVFADDPEVDGAATMLRVNAATSGSGYLRCEVLDANFVALPGFSVGEFDEFYGDTVSRPLTWQGKGDLSALAGTPVRLRFSMFDADLYALRFQ